MATDGRRVHRWPPFDVNGSLFSGHQDRFAASNVPWAQANYRPEAAAGGPSSRNIRDANTAGAHARIESSRRNPAFADQLGAPASTEVATEVAGEIQ